MQGASTKPRDTGCLVKKLALRMIYYTPASERTLSLFKTPFDQSLSPENRWVKMAELVPWDEMAKVSFSSLSSNIGRPTVDLRIVLGALLVKHLENLTDEDTIPYIQENIYAQYFVGLSSFQIEPVFVPSLFPQAPGQRRGCQTERSAHQSGPSTKGGQTPSPTGRWQASRRSATANGKGAGGRSGKAPGPEARGIKHNGPAVGRKPNATATRPENEIISDQRLRAIVHGF
jgi:hypothetical protein